MSTLFNKSRESFLRNGVSNNHSSGSKGSRIIYILNKSSLLSFYARLFPFKNRVLSTNTRIDRYQQGQGSHSLSHTPSLGPTSLLSFCRHSLLWCKSLIGSYENTTSRVYSTNLSKIKKFWFDHFKVSGKSTRHNQLKSTVHVTTLLTLINRVFSLNP